MADESAVAAYVTACRDHDVKRPNPDLLSFFREVEPIASEITSIDLTNNYIGNRGLFALCDVIRTRLPNLKALVLRNQKLYNTDLSESSLKGNAACDRIIATLQEHPSITAVDFSCNLISNYAGRKLLGLAQLNKRMVKIVVDDTRIDHALQQRIVQQCEKNLIAMTGGAVSGSYEYDGPSSSQQQQQQQPNKPASAAAAASSSSSAAARSKSNTSSSSLHQLGNNNNNNSDPNNDSSDTFISKVDPKLLDNAPPGQQPVDLSHMGAGIKHREKVCSEGVDPEKARNYQAPVIEKSAAEMELIMSLLSANVLFSHLGSQTMRTCALAMDRCSFDKGHCIMRQRDVNDKLYILQSGSCDILKEGQKVFLKTAGTAVGELELMYDAPCAATVKCNEAVVAWKLDRDTYRNLVLGSAIRRREEYKNALATIPFLASLDDYERGQLADALSSDEFQPGDTIIKYGEEGMWMYLILEGTVEVVGRTDDGEPEKVCEFGRGHYIGELEFLNRHRTVADCRAKSFVRTAKLNRRHFEMSLGSLKEVLQRNTQLPQYDHYNRLLSRTNSDPDMLHGRRRAGGSNANSGVDLVVGDRAKEVDEDGQEL